MEISAVSLLQEDNNVWVILYQIDLRVFGLPKSLIRCNVVDGRGGGFIPQTIRTHLILQDGTVLELWIFKTYKQNTFHAIIYIIILYVIR